MTFYSAKANKKKLIKKNCNVETHSDKIFTITDILTIITTSQPASPRLRIVEHIRGSGHPAAHPSRVEVCPRVSQAAQTGQTRAQLGVVEFW